VSGWLDLDERDDHYLGLAGASIVAIEALLTTRDNLPDVVAARAMMCVHGDAGQGKTLSVNASLRTPDTATSAPGRRLLPTRSPR
jgi:hypothetical protein